MSFCITTGIYKNISQRHSLLTATSCFGNTFHASTQLKYPRAAALKLPTNVVDINSAETGRFSQSRERDLSGPVLNSYYEKRNQDYSKLDITSQVDPHMNKYDCLGAVSLYSSMQSNVPSPFSGNHTHLNMPGSQMGQGYKYLSDHLHSAHYLTLKNEYRKKVKAVGLGTREMSTDSQSSSSTMTTKEKFKKAIKEYGSTVIIFHVSISLVSLGVCYLLVSSGINIVAVVDYLNLGGGTLSKIVSSNAGTFVVAYAVHKCFAPFRMATTLAVTPFLVRYLRKIGILKDTKK